VLTDAWRDLARSRFPDLPLDCGNARDPGVIYSDDLRDWSDKATTPDQARIESFIDRYDLRNMRILHIGIGNSGLARRFGGRVREIVGTTIDQPEIRVAGSLGISNYSFVIHNKFSGDNTAIHGTFDFILDNNPTSPCCCIRHLSDLFDLYGEKLAPGGQIVTDLQGLAWVPDDSDPRWSFSFEDLAAVAAAAGFTARRMTRRVCVLWRSAPPAPGIGSLCRHLLRRGRILPGQVLRSGPRRVRQASRRFLKRLLLSTIPWALPKRYRSKA